MKFLQAFFLTQFVRLRDDGVLRSDSQLAAHVAAPAGVVPVIHAADFVHLFVGRSLCISRHTREDTIVICLPAAGGQLANLVGLGIDARLQLFAIRVLNIAALPVERVAFVEVVHCTVGFVA